MKYRIVFTNAAKKDYKLVVKSPIKNAVYELLNQLESDPYKKPYEPLIGDLKGAFSRRINIQHRLVYKIDDELKQVTILSMWGHYDDN